MKNSKKIIRYTLLTVAASLIMYVGYFEFIYRTDLVSYFKINTEGISQIKILTDTCSRIETSEQLLTKPSEINEFLNKLSSYTIKKNLYRQFISNTRHQVRIPLHSPEPIFHNIYIYYPHDLYLITIYDGKLIEIYNGYSNTYWFDIIGEPFKP